MYTPSLLRFALALVLAGTGWATTAQAQQLAPEDAEALGIEAATARPADAPVATRGGLEVCVDDVLLIADSGSDGVDVHDPDTGDLVIDDFISDSANLSTPKNAIPNFDGDGIFVIDQLTDGVYEYDCNGDFVGLFAPAGGVNTAVLDNAIAIDYSPDGTELWAAVTGGANADAIARFDQSGTYLGNIVANGEGGLDGPFDVLVRDSDILVPAITSDNIHQYDFMGNFLGAWQSNTVSFPEQAQEISGGNVLVAEFTGSTGVYEYDASGTLLNSFGAVTGSRGVYELPNGNILVTSGSSVKEITRADMLVRDFGSGNQYIELFAAEADGPLGVSSSTDSQTYAQGSQATVTYEVCNNTPAPLSGVAFYEVFRNGNQVVGPRQVAAGTVPANSCTPTLRFTVNVPARAPLGDYDLVVSAGPSNGTAIASSTNTVTVTATARPVGTATSWTLVDAQAWPTLEAAATAAAAEVVAFPNPFRGQTTIQYEVAEAADVRLAVYDVLGRTVAVLTDGPVEAGAHTASFEAQGLASGTYIYRLQVGDTVQSGRITVLD